MTRALPRCGHGSQTLGPDGGTAPLAGPVRSRIDPLPSRLDLRQLRFQRVEDAQLKRSLRELCSAIERCVLHRGEMLVGAGVLDNTTVFEITDEVRQTAFFIVECPKRRLGADRFSGMTLAMIRHEMSINRSIGAGAVPNGIETEPNGTDAARKVFEGASDLSTRPIGFSCMTEIAPANEAQRQYWNEPGGSVWTEWQERMDTQLAPLGDAAIAALGLQPGDRVIDIGCGCGHTTLQVAEAVGTSGTAVGLDISHPMLTRATTRAADMGLINASFVVGDAQVIDADQLGGPADKLVSRFGVMFFADPVAAFGNLLSLVKPGGQLSFVCWQSPRDNSWMSSLGRELAPLFPNQAPVDPTAPGPFAFADPDRVRSILDQSGWTGIDVAPCVRSMKMFGADDFETAVEGSLRLGGAGRLLIGATDELRAQARAVAERVMRTMWTEGGAIVDGSCWLVTATRP